MSYFRQLQDLEDQGIDLIEVLGQDRYLESPEALQKIIEQLARSGESLYTELLHYLTYRRFPPEQAETIWRAIMKHKGRMSEGLGRRVSFRVAALDYLSSRNVTLRQVRLIAKPEFESILSYVNVDEVTGVFNRRYFNEMLAQEFHRARRYEKSLSLLIVDLDEFKPINDALGHLEGDAVLRKVGRLLRESTRLTDFTCRYGGDEFAVLLPETSGAQARVLGDRMRKAVSRLDISTKASPSARWPAFFREGKEKDEATPPASRALTCSIGGATFPADCDEAEELVALADQFCLDAKRRGKDRVVMSDDGRGLPLAAE
jgi:diguanylate cyclase (GGDEF)-like protein